MKSKKNKNRNLCQVWSKICSFHLVCLLKAHMNLHGMQRLYWIMNENTWIINSRSSKTFNLIYTDITKNLFILKKWFSYLPQPYGSLSDNFFVIYESLYYRHLLVLALLVNFISSKIN